MGNHFHLLVRMLSDNGYTDQEITRRYQGIYGEDSLLLKERLGYYRDKCSSLSEFVKELKLGMSRFYNKRHGRRGFFWGDRFKSLIVQKERSRDFKITCPMRFIYRTRYFTDSGIIGTREFVSETYQRFKAIYPGLREKLPKAISGLDGMYSLKRLSEAI
jgi:hypothetical protein